ncbi:diuretic hormone class 2-like isoform X2 [Daphnia pulex]|uniref:Dappu diuretic hormone 31 n=1 Tax=Daphnia pulex TaxID=6669 RepID=E9FRQ3_DAPPU|nr:diuretic hormone class 2-like isoform X2 [Daphnia pulex]XP_046650786.1 diuretic hormone class 2-like isoform X2 [Daphnia pulicaria]EFX90445.1 Dappu diuretic hormone 31 [Daphnia pulex]|eukprot:EFX90445.1 Dappu diuretic hormone 31 [Daphnia pulex]
MSRFVMTIFFLLVACLALIVPGSAAPPRRPMLVDLDDPDSVMEVITRLERSLLRNSDYEHQKRGVDFGLGRGYSGSQAAKHLMGLAAANYAIGPGRKRRDTTESTPEDVKTGAIN